MSLADAKAAVEIAKAEARKAVEEARKQREEKQAHDMMTLFTTTWKGVLASGPRRIEPYLGETNERLLLAMFVEAGFHVNTSACSESCSASDSDTCFCSKRAWVVSLPQ